jgi:hypothetical protein
MPKLELHHLVTAYGKVLFLVSGFVCKLSHILEDHCLLGYGTLELFGQVHLKCGISLQTMST